MTNIFKHPETQLYLVLVSILIIIAFFISVDFGFLLTSNVLGFVCGLWVSKS
jgi:hypothetical protein